VQCAQKDNVASLGLEVKLAIPDSYDQILLHLVDDKSHKKRTV